MVSEDLTILNGNIPEIIVLKLWAIPNSVAISYERPHSRNFNYSVIKPKSSWYHRLMGCFDKFAFREEEGASVGN